MFIPYNRQFIDKDDIKAVTKVLKSDFLTQGPSVNIFEKNISKFVGSKYAVAVNSASAGLHLSCLALGLKKNDILWTVPNTFVSSASCGLHCGAKIDFVDIDEQTNNISIDKLKIKLKKKKKENKLPKILVSVHFSGQPTLQDEIFKLSIKYNFKVIEDASHSLGASYKNTKVGNCKWSDLTVFSFHPVKTITSAEGGVITTNKKSHYELLMKLRTHGITKKLDDLEIKINSKWYYEQQYLGFNYRMNDMQAALGNSQLKKIKKFIKYRNNIANFYFKKLKNFNIDLPYIEKKSNSTFHLFVVKLKTNKLKKRYDQIFKKIISNGIGINLHYLPLHLHPLFKKKGFKKGDFPISEDYAKKAISIPIFYGLSKKKLEKVVQVLKQTIG
jgi:UDP-4-amino-4,6-dideoxy-N-acetyl-beta-L-altrosamine transaminase